MARSTRKIKSPAQLLRQWEEYKQQCDSHTAITHEFSQKLGCFVSETLNKPLPYTKVGFCAFLGISKQSFRDTYESDPDYTAIVTRIRDACELDMVSKLVTGNVPSQLAGLMLSKYGYTTKTENDVTVTNPVVIRDTLGEDDD